MLQFWEQLAACRPAIAAGCIKDHTAATGKMQTDSTAAVFLLAALMPVSDRVAAMLAAENARNAELDRRYPRDRRRGKKKSKLDAKRRNPRVMQGTQRARPDDGPGPPRRICGAGRGGVTGVREGLLLGATGFSPIREGRPTPRASSQSVEEVSKRFGVAREGARPA